MSPIRIFRGNKLSRNSKKYFASLRKLYQHSRSVTSNFFYN